MEEYQNFSKDDLLFEIKRLLQRNTCLVSDIQILQQENDLLTSMKADGGLNSKRLSLHQEQDYENLKKKYQNLLQYSNLTKQKFIVIQRFLLLEKSTIQDIKIEVKQTVEEIVRTCQQKLILFNKDVQSRDYGLQQKLLKFTQELISEKTKNEKLTREKTILQEKYSELEQKYEKDGKEMELSMNLLSNKFINYQEEHEREVKKLQLDLSDLTTGLRHELTEKTQIIQQKENEISVLMKESQATQQLLKQSQEKSEILSSQFSQLVQTNSNLQKDFQSVLFRYEKLQTELKSKSSSNTTIENKLQSITRKLHEVEEMSMREMEELQIQLQNCQKEGMKQQEEAKEWERRCEREKERSEELARECQLHKQQKQDLEEQFQKIQHSEEISRKLIHDLEVLNQENERKILELKKCEGAVKESNEIILNQQVRLNEANVLNQELLAQLNQMKSTQLQQDKVVKEVNEMKLRLQMDLKGMQTENENLKNELISTNKLLTDMRMAARSGEEIKELQQIIANKTMKIEELLGEIERLKDTIRRECEERTEMLIEMSELRDQLKRYSSLQLRSKTSSSENSTNGTSRSTIRSTSIGVGNESYRPEEINHINESLLERNTSPPTDDVTPSMSAEDKNWMKMRRPPHGQGQGQGEGSNGSKSKRKSKYR